MAHSRWGPCNRLCIGAQELQNMPLILKGESSHDLIWMYSGIGRYITGWGACYTLLLHCTVKTQLRIRYSDLYDECTNRISHTIVSNHWAKWSVLQNIEAMCSKLLIGHDSKHWSQTCQSGRIKQTLLFAIDRASIFPAAPFGLSEAWTVLFAVVNLGRVTTGITWFLLQKYPFQCSTF